MRQFFRAGTSSRVIDLIGRQRAIRQIIVTYVPSGPARIQFYGVEGGGGGGVMPTGSSLAARTWAS